MKRPGKLTRRQKKKLFKTPANYYQAKGKRVAKLVAASIEKNVKDLDPEFSKTVDENFWDLI